MNRIAAVTVIRGEGECEAFIHGIADEEIKRKQDRMRAEKERARAVKASRDRLLARRMACIRRKLNPKLNTMQRIWGRFVDAWALTWAVVYYWPTMILNLCLKKRWIVKDN